MADGVNPVYDKEMRSELFGQGTLMLRLVIQLSMFLALPLMAVCLYIKPDLAPWYVGYVLLFNMLVGPVFSAGSDHQRTRAADARIAADHDAFALADPFGQALFEPADLVRADEFPRLAAAAGVAPAAVDLPGTTRSTMLVYVAIIVVTSLTTTTLAMFCSVLFRKTTVSMMTAYLIVIGLFAAPIAVKVFADTFTPAPAAIVHHEPTGQIAEAAEFWLVGPKGASGRIAVEPGASLEELAEAINAESRDTGVAAVVKGRDLLIRQEGTDASLPVGFHLLSGAFETRIPATIQFRRALFVSPFAAALSMPLTCGKDIAAHTGEALVALDGRRRSCCSTWPWTACWSGS